MFAVLVISILAFLIVWFKMKPKQLYVMQPTKKQKEITFTEALTREGYDRETMNEIAYQMSCTNYKSQKSYILDTDTESESELKEWITAREYYELTNLKQCYAREKSKDTFKDYVGDLTANFETEVNMYRLQKQFRGLSIDEVMQIIKPIEKQERQYEVEYEF